jgi:hypothetical protein
MSGLPLLPISSAATIAACAALELLDDDVFICSYPKSGTTWSQNIVHKLISDGERNVPHISDSAPFFEIDAHWEDGALDAAVVEGHRVANRGRRVFNTHLLWSMLPRAAASGARYIYVVRAGVDVAFSFFKHLSSQEEGGWDCATQGGWDAFFTAWMRGEIAYGKWSAHVGEWMAAAEAHPDRILVVRFEDLVGDLAAEVRRVAAFIGAAQSDARIDAMCAALFTFAAMKADAAQFQPRSVGWKHDAATGRPFEFLRRGAVGDGAKNMSAEQRALFVASLAVDVALPVAAGERSAYPPWVCVSAEHGRPTGAVETRYVRRSASR